MKRTLKTLTYSIRKTGRRTYEVMIVMRRK